MRRYRFEVGFHVSGAGTDKTHTALWRSGIGDAMRKDCAEVWSVGQSEKSAGGVEQNAAAENGRQKIVQHLFDAPRYELR